MLAIGGPASQSTLSGAASQAVPTSPPVRRRLVPLMGLGVVAAAAVGVLVVLRGGGGPEREPANATSATVIVDAAVTASTSDAAVAADAPSAAVATQQPDTEPPRDAGVSSRVVVRDDKSRRAETTVTKPSVKVPREMGEIRVIVEKTYAEIYVNGKHVASTPWAGKLPVGTHTVTLRNDDTGRRETHKVTITAANPTIIERPW